MESDPCTRSKAEQTAASPGISRKRPSSNIVLEETPNSAPSDFAWIADPFHEADSFLKSVPARMVKRTSTKRCPRESHVLRRELVVTKMVTKWSKPSARLGLDTSFVWGSHVCSSPLVVTYHITGRVTSQRTTSQSRGHLGRLDGQQAAQASALYTLDPDERRAMSAVIVANPSKKPVQMCVHDSP